MTIALFSAPTGAGFGASTLSTTTAAFATSSSVQAVARVAVIASTGAYSVGGWHYWNEANNEQAQNKAKEKYCAANPTDSVCGQTSTSWGNVNSTYQIKVPSEVTSYSVRSSSYIQTGWSKPYYLNGGNSVSIEDKGIPGRTLIWSFTGTLSQGVFTAVPSAYSTKSPKPGSFYGRVDFTFYSPTKDWKDWSQEKRNAAVKLLNNSDWQNLITSMPEGGKLNPGDKINAPIIVIPGQEADVPNTPADERILKKDSGFFKWSGRNDFDFDADGTADSADPEPQNPSVPTASSNPPSSSSDPSSTPPDSNEPLDTSQEPRPEPLSEIPETARAKDLAEAKAAELRNTLPKKDRPTATAAVVDTRTGKVYYGTSGKPLPTTIDEYLAERMPVPSEEPWEVSNCAEFKAVNDALLDGANIRDLEVHTVRTRSGEAYPRCRNCRKTIDGPNVTSDP